MFRAASRVGLAILGTVAHAQYSGWIEKQANASMCTWRLPRVGIVRDTLFMDGGELSFSRGMEDGEYTTDIDYNPRGLMLSLSLKKSFSLTDNVTALLDTHPRTSGSSNDIVPYYVDGALLANDAQFFLYGGLTQASDSFPDPDADFVSEYQAHAYEGKESGFKPGFVSDALPDGVTRYAVYGAGVSAPSENRAWYFSGVYNEAHGPSYSGGFGDDAALPVVSRDFISVEFDEESQNSETWKNATLPGSVGKRGGAQGVFVPVGEEGILVFVGGVTHGEFANGTAESSNPAALKSESEAFMTEIDVYDIASDEWYKQKTSSDHPPILAMGCAVAQAAQDGSSFNIYHYGGYGGVDPRDPFNDDVWILSLPSFKWIKAKSGTSMHARAGHRCVSPYPDQMMVVGGYAPLAGSGGPDCLPDSVFAFFNLSSLEWLDSYDPEVYADYRVPEVVTAEIGGDGKGGAKEKEPDGGWDDDALGEVFGKKYPEDRIKTWYPYGSEQSTERPDVDGEDEEDGDGGLPGWVPPTLGVVLGLIFVVICGVAFIFWRRRKVLRRGSMARSSVQGGK